MKQFILFLLLICLCTGCSEEQERKQLIKQINEIRQVELNNQEISKEMHRMEQEESQLYKEIIALPETAYDDVQAKSKMGIQLTERRQHLLKEEKEIMREAEDKLKSMPINKKHIKVLGSKFSRINYMT